MIAAVLIPIIISVFGILGYAECRIALHRRKHRKKSSGKLIPMSPAAFHADREWLNSMVQEDVYTDSPDGYRLYARYISHTENSAPAAILCHGYRANSASTAPFAHLLYEEGFSLLIPDARAHGKSEGAYIGMGSPERKDILAWIRFLNEQLPNRRILLFGISMGGTTVMNTVGEPLPENVLAAVSDCGFSSMHKLFAEQLKARRLPPILLLPADPFCRILAGFSIADKDSITKSLQRCRTPMLFIHGLSDSFVPFSHAERAYDACGSEKRLLRVPNAGHADSIMTDPDGYRQAVHDHIIRCFHQ